ncbi:MAG: hypothetical protein ABIF01_02570, partial [Candidatus Micrarchaeota archaeon]
SWWEIMKMKDAARPNSSVFDRLPMGVHIDHFSGTFTNMDFFRAHGKNGEIHGLPRTGSGNPPAKQKVVGVPDAQEILAEARKGLTWSQVSDLFEFLSTRFDDNGITKDRDAVIRVLRLLDRELRKGSKTPDDVQAYIVSMLKAHKLEIWVTHIAASIRVYSNSAHSASVTELMGIGTSHNIP